MQIRDVDEDVRDRLKEHASADGVSLNTYLKELLAREASLPRRAEVVDRLRSRIDITTRPGAEIIMEARADRVAQ